MVDNIGANLGREGHNLASASSSASGEEGIKEQDRLLPIANVGRIMKQTLPPNAKISKEAKETMQECVSEFISFVTGEASDKCQKDKRKTVNGDDICWALGTLGFDEYAEALKRYLHIYRELEGERANQNKPSNVEEKDEESGLKKDTNITPTPLSIVLCRLLSCVTDDKILHANTPLRLRKEIFSGFRWKRQVMKHSESPDAKCLAPLPLSVAAVIAATIAHLHALVASLIL
ncbi:Transcription factor CBF/NF-Y/archaeal histone domain [Dillenia turbinata]|uniref:Transcription factor CBF/NF-Y/archaeal histone domain n=1 Tax=Dillenia turbinata TaxID=194707 RepID=A0AAN8VP55_9MAGN